MIPFCRTPEEAEKVNELLMKNGLVRGKNGLEVYMMIEIPSNVLLLDQFGKYYDGFSIGSNDLTQLTLGLDRDSPEVSDSFDEMNEAVVELILSAIQQAKKLGKKIGICGQAPSDNPDFTELLINSGIDSISFNTDAFMNGIKTMANAEKNIKQLVWND
jgi:pyruvate,water dikinase